MLPTLSTDGQENAAFEAKKHQPKFSFRTPESIIEWQNCWLIFMINSGLFQVVSLIRQHKLCSTLLPTGRLAALNSWASRGTSDGGRTRNPSTEYGAASKRHSHRIRPPHPLPPPGRRGSRGRRVTDGRRGVRNSEDTHFNGVDLLLIQ